MPKIISQLSDILYSASKEFNLPSPLSKSKNDVPFFGYSPLVWEKRNSNLESLPNTSMKIEYLQQQSIWKINNNNGDNFRFFNINGERQGFLYEREQISDQSERILETEMQCALGAVKNTEVLTILPEDFPNQINIDLLNPNAGSISYIKAAAFSATYILQRAFCSDEDIDPTEISILDMKKYFISDGERSVFQVSLSDTLPNGSGFVRKLYDEIKNNDLINDILSLVSLSIIKRMAK